jgi:hypothetical protein
MSEENVEIVLGGLRRFGAGEPIAEVWHEDAVLSAPEGWPEPGPFEGRGAIMRQLERLGADYAEQHFDDVEVVADTGEWVVASVRWYTRGAHSDIETSFDMAAAFRVREGRYAEVHYRWSVDEALEAAGLGE